MSDEEITKIVRNIWEVNYREEEIDYWIEVLEKETGLYNFSDYIYWPNLVGLTLNASFEETMNKILKDKK